MTLNCIWWWGSNPGALGNVECPFVAITSWRERTRERTRVVKEGRGKRGRERERRENEREKERTRGRGGERGRKWDWGKERENKRRKKEWEREREREWERERDREREREWVVLIMVKVLDLQNRSKWVRTPVVLLGSVLDSYLWERHEPLYPFYSYELNNTTAISSIWMILALDNSRRLICH